MFRSAFPITSAQRFTLLLFAIVLFSGARIRAQSSCIMPTDIADNQLSRCEYADRLRAMWLAETIANWTGLTTEGVRIEAPFYTDEDWGLDQNISWKRDDVIDFVFQDPWLADDDTDIEYVYLHLMTEHNTHLLSAQQIMLGWQAHINDFIWVSNAHARGMMEFGGQPPVTSMGALNPQYLQIDAQLTTEIFGALAPGMPAQALQMADLPVRTTAGGYAAHAAQFFVVMYSLATQVDPALSPAEQNMWLVQEARRYIPDSSKTADVVDFILADYLANPDKNNWELTRDKVYERYHTNAGDYGFVYRYWTESSVNLATGVMALLYGEGDFRRTVQIGTLSGWDSDNGTATVGGLLGLMQGYDAIVAQFPEEEISDHYRIWRTRPTVPDNVPAISSVQDTFTLMAERMLPIVEQALMNAGGSVDGDIWTLPPVSDEDPLQLNPLQQLSQRSANLQVPLLGGTVEVDVTGERATSLVRVIADGAEHDFSGQEVNRPPRFYRSSTTENMVTLTVTYDRAVEVAIIRLIEGSTNAISQLEAEILIDGQWQAVPEGTVMTQQPDPTIPYQMIDFELPEPVAASGIRLIATIPPEARLPEIDILELDALAN